MNFMTDAEKRYRTSPKGRLVCQRSQQKTNRRPERKAAMRVARKKWVLAHPARVKAMMSRWRHKAKYGEPFADKMKRIEKQNGRCANPGCRTSEPGYQGWQTDHDHATGQIRGELCSGCNKALGFLKDDERHAQGLVLYLRGYR